MFISGTFRFIQALRNMLSASKIHSLYLFMTLILACGQANAQATLSISTPTSDGTFTVTWSGLHNFVRLNEGFMALGTTTMVWSAPQDKPRTGSMTLQKTQPGTYVYNFTDCRVVSGSTTCSAGAGASVTISVPQPTVTAMLSPTTISEGGSATLTWSSTNAANCTATGISGVSGPSGSVTYQAPTVMSTNQTVTIPVSCFNGAATATTNAVVEVQWVNDAPSLSVITDRIINEDGNTGAVAFTVTDEETPTNSLVIAATSSNTNVIPNGNLVLGGSGANRTITATPAANAHGSATITVKATDAHGALAQRAFTVTVNSVNDAPNISDIPNITIDENQDTGVRSFTVGDIDTAVGSLTVTVMSSNTALVPDNNIVLGGSGSSRTIKVTPLLGKSGSATITVTVSDGSLTSSDSFGVTVNNLPIKFDSITETTSTGVISMSWSKASGFVQLSERFGMNGTWTLIRDNAPTSGSHSITKIQSGTYYYRVLDCYYAGGSPNGNLTCTDGDVRTAVVTLPAPTVNASISPATINEGETATLAWNSTNAASCSATGISGVSATSGNVTYTAPSSMNANQQVTIPVTCTGGGGSTTDNATLTVNWINDIPIISAIAAQTINEDSSTGALAFTVVDEETAPASLIVTSISSNTNLIPNSNLVLGGSEVNRTLTITPTTNAFGSATITVKVTDAHGGSAQRTFNITVNPVNDAPTISTIASITIDENQDTGGRSFTVADAETSAGSLSVTATSNNTALVPNNQIVFEGSGGSRTIKVVPLADKVGSATITVTVSDGQLSANRSFVLTVRDMPAKFTVTPETSSTGVYTISWSGAKEYALLTERIFRSGVIIDNGIIEVGTSGSRSYTKTENGTYIYVLQDCYRQGGPPNGNPVCVETDSRVIEVTFPAPVITASFSPATINESPPSGNANIATLTWNATNAHTCSATGIVGISSTSGSVTYTAPSILSASHQISAVITCTGQGPSSSSKTATLMVNAVNDPPTISPIPEQFIQEDQSSPVLTFTVADEETTAGSLIVTVASDNDALIPQPNIQLGGSGATRTIRVTPKANAYGSANITIRVSDGQTTVLRTFKVNVASVNDAPTISPIPDQRIALGAASPTLNFTVGDLETSAASLVVTASSDKASLIAPSGIVLGGSGASRTLKITPVVGQSGLATVTVQVTDPHGGEYTLPIKVSVLPEINSPFDMSDIPAAFDYSLSGGVTALGNGEFVAITQGSLSVNGGTASYNIPIELPPAIRDLAPKLSLGYTSHNSDGVMGVGWSLGGLSSIHRCRTTFATEGAEAQKSNPRYTHSDRLCLDGQKLVIADSTTSANDSTYWVANAEYQTEIDSFTRIKAQGSHQGGPQYFTLTTKDGRTLTFGQETDSQNSRIYAPGQSNGSIKAWALDKVEDRYGNSYQVHYLRDTEKGEYYPSHITWEPEAAVVFSYIDRTGNTPWGYDGGHKYERTKLLDKVTTYIGVTDSSTPTAGAKVQEYDIDYQLSETTNRHLVKEIRECGFTAIAIRECAKPLQFEWQLGELGFENTSTPLQLTNGQGLSVSDVSYFDDIDGDGFVDVVGEKKIVAWGSANGFVAANDSESEFVRTIQTRFGKYMVRGVLRGDYVDVKIVHASLLGAVTHSTVVSVLKTELPHIHAVDLNNDALTDLYIGDHFLIQQDNASFVESPATAGLPYKAPYPYSGIQPHFVDINNDGLPDRTGVTFHGLNEGRYNNVLYGYANEKDKFGSISSGMRVSSASPLVKTIGIGHIFSPSHYRYTSNIGFWHSWIDINGDGNADVLYGDSHSLVWQWAIRLSTADGLSYAQQPLIPTGASVVPMNDVDLGQYSFVMDYNKDGVDDFIVFHSSGPSERIPRVFYGSYVNGVLAFNNGGIDPFMGNLDYLVDLEIAPAEETVNPFRGDINNDGIPDLIFGGTAYYAKQQQPDLLIKIIDGFGAESELDYSPLVDDDNNGKPLYTPDSTPPTFPQAPVDRSMQVVKKLSVSNGIGGKVHTYFNYTGGKRDLQGRGFLGFAKIETTNTGSGVETATHYLQTFPYTGRMSEVLVKDNTSGNLISRTQHHYTIHSNNGRFPYLDYSLQQDYQLLTSSQSNPLAVSKVDNSYDACGNLTSRTTVVGTGLSGTHVTGDLGTTALTNTIPNAGDDDCSDDFVTETTVTSTEAGGINPRTVTSAFVPNEQFDVHQQTVFEGTALEVVTTTNRDEQGIIINSGAVAADLNSATTADRTTVFSDYDKGIYPATVTNAKGHVATLAYDYRFGKVNQDADPNGLISSRVYDSLGRNVQETATDGTITELLSWYCVTAPVACPGNAVYLAATRITNPGEPDKLGAPLSVTYYDSLQREVRSEVHSLDLTVVKSDTQYTAEGYVHRVSEPFTGFASYWTTYSNYDALGRANTVTGPDGGSLSVSYSRDGTLLKTTETVTVVTPDGNDTQITNRYTNALGQVTKVVDAHNTPVDYTYDAQGNLKTTVVNNNLLTTITVVHDLAGNKTRITDPDAGVIDFAYNGFGELRKQTWQPDLTGHNKSITYTYDTLGRQTGRTDLSASGNAISYAWTWDASGQLGLLASQSGNGYTESYGYDHLSRVQTLTTTIAGLSGSRVFTYGYDNFSRPTTTAYPGGLSVTRDYHASGIHVRTRDITGGANNTLWALGNQKNERGQSTHELYGNGVVTAHAYAENNGLLSGITSGRLTASNTVNDLHGDIQALSYEFDSLGNLHSRTTQRSDNNGLSFENTTESFAYDNLNRVTTSTTSGLFSRFKDYDYDDLGNLTYRSDLGTLAYNRTGNAGVHAITAAGESGTPGYKTYAYDKYGNMTNRGGETITYDVFNKPLTISGSNGTTSFSYGPNHERFKQVGGGKTTYVINGGAYEEIIDTSTGAVTQKSYVDGFMVQTKIGSTTEITYLHKDHLGSTEAMTDVKGNLLNRMSFDVWGNRQKADWQSGIPAAGELNAFKTTKGYTGHEQLDQHNLVHMGGRVYDPTLGRFLSADLFIQSPYNTQSFNRYSYVFNNPLSLIDPTGYFSDMMQWAMESSYQHSAGWSWSVNYQAAQSQISNLENKKEAQQMYNDYKEAGLINDWDDGVTADYFYSNGVINGVQNYVVGCAETCQQTAFVRSYMSQMGLTPSQMMSLLKAADSATYMTGMPGIAKAGARKILTRELNEKAAEKKASAYSVAFETTIAKSGAGTRSSHSSNANKNLSQKMNEDPEFAKLMESLGIQLPQKMGQSPAGWSWHHSSTHPGVMQLVPRSQHQGSAWQHLLHPNNVGGFKLWGKYY